MKKKHSLSRLQSRREALIKGAAALLAATGLGTPGVLFAQSVVTRTPGETEGPYWVDAGIERSDVRSDSSTGTVEPGLPLQLMMNISQLNDDVLTPVSDAQVDIWHCNALGVYSDVAAQNTVGQDFLRGYQLTNGHGNVRFLSIYPGWYRGRTVHIHFRVRLYSDDGSLTYNFVSQLYFADEITDQVFQTDPYDTRPNRDTRNSMDMIFSGPSQGVGGTVDSESGEYLLLRLADNGTHAIASFNVVL
jgi:protocatechuate 3,4-dioxygenase beta subunit